MPSYARLHIVALLRLAACVAALRAIAAGCDDPVSVARRALREVGMEGGEG